jgi:hypothetical protein
LPRTQQQGAGDKLGNPIIAYGNTADSAILSGGSWRQNLPLKNLTERTLGRLARTDSTDLNSTHFDIDNGIDHLVRVIALLNHNIDFAGSFRIRGSNDSSFIDVGFDSDWTQVWPSVYPPDQVEWESDNFWFGTYKLDDVKGYPAHLIFLLDASLNYRYWRIELDDQGNSAGYLQFGRLFIADGWQPINGIDMNYNWVWEDPSTVTETLSGSEYFDGKNPYRVIRFTTHYMDENEAMSKAFEIQRRSGVWKEVLYIHDPDDTLHQIRRRFPGRLRTLGQNENPYPNAFQTAWELKEVLP